MADDYDNVTEECFTSTKSYYNFPCAHRQYRHEGNCHLIHGYSRSFHFVFGIKTFTKEGFAVDYGDLDELELILWDLAWKVLHIIFVTGQINGYVKNLVVVLGLLV